MQEADAQSLPARVETEADAILVRARGLAAKHFGPGVIDGRPELVASVATMMMQNYSAMLLYDGLARLTHATVQKEGN